MICPLRKIQSEGVTVSGDCLREKCAWWVNEDKVCAILSIANAFLDFPEILSQYLPKTIRKY